MPTHHAAACGGIAGLLLGVIIALINDMQVTDAAYRLLILALGGAWMGSILAMLNALLMPDSDTGAGGN
ncbi:MAG: hypothetical protein COW19_03815 [Zetaproteobacteria bacterium CG12_big_fil_rev_8_21_14_0_65_55_1124]|nr:MAG: hypothetical protein AUJ58_09225 [Zetaproteobacteria bacterium CG1_02_55_237]PIS18675.1 MAG: hypothetical protein COT53_09705 [Zetaproteobacteria bacterium CG08_land_8_20_14_0_20_55_17]PIW43279.1 MAG: hypothetical protein COW19_03815 [Zetaproteobacteria bacterium CG12_big_fil_rev_8_21_14_0_65_55_1124]PIY53410.1 MAG: hypothetical protein COZ01_04050 [Zetaproteobacteria bacterium CG_4_10_14_0_8_um_filter_55_43]PIZ38687.1 MAG: hypothetical protein COY36_05445 [Zetaproteobacteria bacterium 